jgi:hypothetical protein
MGWLPLPGTEIKDSFRPNQSFLQLLHLLIAKYAPTSQALRDEAPRLGALGRPSHERLFPCDASALSEARPHKKRGEKQRVGARVR